MEAIERAIEDITDWTYFESLCCRVLNTQGYDVDPRGGAADGGRDAIEGSTVTFQFSLRDRPADKLQEELERYRDGKKASPQYVFATNQAVSSKSKDDYESQFEKLGMKLLVCDRSWLATKLDSVAALAAVRTELLAKALIAAPDIIRFALNSPLRYSILGVLASSAKESLTDERLFRIRALMSIDRCEAERLLRALLEGGALLKEQEFEARTHLGNLLLTVGKLTDAKTEWAAAIQLGVPNQVPATNLATTLLLVEKDAHAARRVVDKGLAIDPRCPGLLNVKGLLTWADGAHQEALDLFRMAYDIEKRPEFLLNEWNLLAETTGRTAAEGDIKDALAQYPEHKDLRLIYANRMFEEYQSSHDRTALHKASESLAKAFPVDLALLEHTRDRTSVSPLDHDWMGCALNTLAGIVYWQGDLVRAASLIELAVLFEPDPFFQFSAGQIHMASGQIEKAVSCYEAADAAGYGKPELWCQLGNAHFVLFRRTRAMRHARAAVAAYEKAAKDNPSIVVNLAQLAWDMGRRDDARTFVRLALQANPNEPAALCNSLTYSCDGDPAAILKALPALEAAHPSNPNVLTLAGESHYHLRNWDSAVAYFRRAIDAAGPNSFVLEQVYPLAAKALLRQGGGGAQGRVAAIEFLLNGAMRLPHSIAIQSMLQALASD